MTHGKIEGVHGRDKDREKIGNPNAGNIQKALQGITDVLQFAGESVKGGLGVTMNRADRAVLSAAVTQLGKDGEGLSAILNKSMVEGKLTSDSFNKIREEMAKVATNCGVTPPKLTDPTYFTKVAKHEGGPHQIDGVI